MDIVIIRDCFHTLTDVVIIDPTHTNLVQHASMMITHAMTIVI
jgi:hypothetical protein